MGSNLPRAARRQDAGHGTDDEQQDGHADVGRGIVPVDVVELVLQELGGKSRADRTKDETDENDPQAVSDHEPRDVARERAEREPDAHLAGTLETL